LFKAKCDEEDIQVKLVKTCVTKENDETVFAELILKRAQERNYQENTQHSSMYCKGLGEGSNKNPRVEYQI